MSSFKSTGRRQTSTIRGKQTSSNSRQVEPIASLSTRSSIRKRKGQEVVNIDDSPIPTVTTVTAEITPRRSRRNQPHSTINDEESFNHHNEQEEVNESLNVEERIISGQTLEEPMVTRQNSRKRKRGLQNLESSTNITNINQENTVYVNDPKNDTNVNQGIRKRRANTPDGAEDFTIVPSMVTMFELASRNRRMGKTSLLEGKMKNADWIGAQARRKEEEQRMALSKNARTILVTTISSQHQQQQGLINENIDGEDINVQIAKASRKSRLNRQELSVRVVDGQHLVNSDSQNVNRHELANHDVAGLKEVDQGDLTRKFNSQSFVHMKRRDPTERIPSKDRWTTEETIKFYECLSTFGTDFLVISKMFPGKSRRHIKAKFVREERSEPERIRRLLVGDERGEWNLESYKEATGIDDINLRTLKSMDEELEGIREEHMRELEIQREKTKELNQQRQLASEQFAS